MNALTAFSLPGFGADGFAFGRDERRGGFALDVEEEIKAPTVMMITAIATPLE